MLMADVKTHMGIIEGFREEKSVTRKFVLRPFPELLRQWLNNGEEFAKGGIYVTDDR